MGTPFNGLGAPPEFEHPADGLRQAGLIPLKEEDVVVYGIRAWDQIFGSEIPVYDRTRMTVMGIKAAVQEGLETFTRRNLPLWLHFDVDVLDPEWMPVMFPEPGGLTVDQVREFLSLVRALGRAIDMSIACYHPRLDIEGRAGARVVTLLSKVLSDPASF